MIWGNKYEKQWNEAYQLLCEYYKKNGSFDIPVSYVTDNGVALGKWIRHQRDFFEKGKLSEERIEKLRNIGYVLKKVTLGKKNSNWQKLILRSMVI